MSWFECPGCDKIVTGLVCGTGPKDDNSYYSKTHCCLQCERGEGSQSSDVWACPAIPKGSFRATALPSCDVPAHYILHLPETAGALPTILFLHGGVTYIYPESLWYDVQHLVARNPVVRERFIVIAPFAAIGEPIATVSGNRKKSDRYGNTVDYVDDFNEDLIWTTFSQACQALGDRVDWSRLSVAGYSMGGQSAWNLSLRYGSQLAAIVPFSGCCAWSNFDWNDVNAEDTVLKELEHLLICSYDGEEDRCTYSWRDFTWLAAKRALDTQPDESESKHSDDVKVTAYKWGERLQLCLMRGTATPHCCWDAVFHNEDSFKSFSWLETCHRILE